MRRRQFWKKPKEQPGEAQAHLAKARHLDWKADWLNATDERLIRGNGFAPKVQAAFGARHR